MADSIGEVVAAIRVGAPTFTTVDVGFAMGITGAAKEASDMSMVASLRSSRHLCGVASVNGAVLKPIVPSRLR
jgi:hypothetical protein